MASVKVSLTFAVDPELVTEALHQHIAEVVALAIDTDVPSAMVQAQDVNVEIQD